jgi:hypothetical protein
MLARSALASMRASRVTPKSRQPLSGDAAGRLAFAASQTRCGARTDGRNLVKSPFLVPCLVLVMPALAGSQGDCGPTHFECPWVDVDKNAVGTHSFSDMKFARMHGHWLVKDIRVGNIEKL